MAIKEPKEKVHLKDIQVITMARDEKVYVVGDKKMWADRVNIDTLATHRDCENCGIEFEKRFTHEKKCQACRRKQESENYQKLPLVEWDGSCPLFDWDSDDKYFYDESDIDEYCEDNEIDKSSLRLVLCEKSHFPEVNIYDQFEEVVHEDWEPSKELKALVDALNAHLKTADTHTWFPIDKRVIL